MYNPFGGNKFPYTNFHELNLDWIIEIAKNFLDQYTHIQEIIENGETSISNLTESGLEQLQQKADDLKDLLQAWYTEHSEDIANQLADALEDLNSWYTEHEGYLDQYVTDSISAFNTAAEQKATETIASIPDDYTELSNDVDSLIGSVHPLYIITKGTKTTWFNLSSVADNGGYIYTLTTVSKGTMHGITDLEVGSDYAQYKFEYASGSNNVGTSAGNYKYDNSIVSSSITGFAAFVADRSDYTLKIVDLRYLSDDQRVIAIFYGATPSLQSSLTSFGDNAALFNIRNRGINKFYLMTPNNARCALTWSKDANNIYTVTRNTAVFGAFGITECNPVQMAIGAGRNDIKYPFPSSFSSASNIDGFAVIAANWADETSSTWVIISLDELNNNLDKYIVLGMIYGNAVGIFFTELAEQLFTNIVYGNTYYTEYTAQMSHWNDAISNSIAVIRGKVIFDPVNYTVTFDHVVLAPNNGYPGSYYYLKAEDTYVVDWSSESNPSYLRAIYIDKRTNNFVAYSQENLNTTALQNEKRLLKDGLLLICMVFNGKFVYTCGTALPGQWFINDKDIYDTSFENGDLYKAFQRVGVIGDSLSVGYLYNKTTGTATTRNLEYSWPKKVMKDAGNYWLNLGTSGQNVLTWCSNNTYGKVQLETANNKCQAYIIGLGENDQATSGNNVPLGDPDDIVDDYSQTATTYYGGYARIIQLIKHLNSNAKIFCLTNPRSGGNRASYNEAVRYICNTYYSNDNNVVLVDLATEYKDVFNSGYLPADSSAITGGHYSAAGYARIASVMEKAITNAMQRNVSSMWDVAFIPYDTGEPSANTMTV